MKKYILFVLGITLSLEAFFSRRTSDNISRDSKLSIVLAYYGPDKSQDKQERKVAQQFIKDIERSFNNFKKDRWYRKIGVEFSVIDLALNSNFADRYKDDLSHEPQVLFFERGKLLKKETITVKNARDLTKALDKKLKDDEGQVGDILEDLEEAYEKEQEELAKIRATVSSSIWYDPWYYNRYGWNDPYCYSPSWGWGIGFYGHRHCR